MFKETRDAEFLNYICNHKDVRAGGKIDVDVSLLLDHGIAYSYENGAIIYAFKEPGIYEAHTQALKSGRGKTLREFIAWTLDDMFKNKGVLAVTSYSFHDNQVAKRLALEFLKPDFSDEKADYYRLTREEFLCQ